MIYKSNWKINKYKWKIQTKGIAMYNCQGAA